MNIVPRNCKKSDLLISLRYTYLTSGIFTVQPHCLHPSPRSPLCTSPFSLSLFLSPFLLFITHLPLSSGCLIFFWLLKASLYLSRHSRFDSDHSVPKRLAVLVMPSQLSADAGFHSIHAHFRGSDSLGDLVAVRDGNWRLLDVFAEVHLLLQFTIALLRD